MVFTIKAQTLGGNAVFSFLKQPNTAQLSALGGINLTTGQDIGLAFQNPALLVPDMHRKVDASFNAFIAGIGNYSITSAWSPEGKAISWGMGINYLNYGTMDMTDAAGNTLGSFSARDYVVQLMASHAYKEHWRLGSSIKFIHSGYGPYRSSAIAMDIGLNYHDEDNGWQAALVFKNIGTQLSTYSGNGSKQELPFDVQAGITKRLKNAPLQFSLTLHELHRLNNFYNDTAFRVAEGDDITRATTLQRVFNHIVLSAQCYPSKQLELSMGYNFQRRLDLNGFNIANGLNGFTLGTGILLPQVKIRYATGFYQRAMFHQFSLGLSL
jgi:hypothetical protein